MADVVPPIYAPPALPIRLSARHRLVAAGVAFLLIAPLIVGAWLTPDPAGVGTHRQLGWPPCATLLATGVPCPSCGMTTSVAWFAHGNWAASFYLQPMAALLGLLLVWGFWLAAYVAVTGRPVHRLLGGLHSRWTVLFLGAVLLAGWGWKLYLHGHGLDRW